MATDPLPNLARKGPPRLSDATEPIESGAKPHHMTDPWEIGEALARLAESGDAVTIHVPSSTKPLMARILSVDEELPHFVLELNEGDVLAPGLVTFVALVHSAKLQFTLNLDWTPEAEHATHYLAVFPAECLILERRESARLETPLGAYYLAAFVLDGRPYELQLYDFSMGGIGMRAPPRDTVGLYVGRKLPRVRLELGQGKVMIADLEVRLSRTFRSFLLGEQVQIGCRFVNLSPLIQEQFKGLIAQLEGSRKGR